MPTWNEKARPEADRDLAAVYALIPALECQGRCQASCGIIGPTRLERAHMRRALGHPLPHLPAAPTDLSGAEPQPCETCPLLVAGRCSVYEARPIECRLYGAVDHPLMVCQLGCIPERYLSDREARVLMARVEEISRKYEGV